MGSPPSKPAQSIWWLRAPPFLALRSYLPADHPLKGKEMGSEPTPAEFVDSLLRVTAELRWVLAPHGSICVELGDTYTASGGAGGDYAENGLRDGQPKFKQRKGNGWPLDKSKALIPEAVPDRPRLRDQPTHRRRKPSR